MSAYNKFLIEEYKARINKVFDYIEMNLSKQFTLEELAEVANFSKYHFHRIFYSLTRETPSHFINRIRIERIADALILNPKKSITEIAYDFGFSDPAVFARSFKACFNCSASEWRRRKQNANSNICKEESIFNQTFNNLSKEENNGSIYFSSVSNNKIWSNTMVQCKNVEVKDLPTLTVAYVRYIGPYKGDAGLFEKLFNKLFTWAGPRNLLSQPDLKTIVVYHDNLEITDEDKLRTSVCITVPEDTKVDGEIGKMQINAGKFALARFELGVNDFAQAWDWVYSSWLPASGYQPDDGPCFELYPEESKNGKFIVDICVPVRPL